MKLVSQKYNNTQYAPGLPLYGVDGRDGKSGMNGTSLFVSQYDISNAEALKNFGNCIRQGKMPVVGSSKFIGRDYIDGDTFLFPNRQLYKISDIVGLNNVADHLTSDSFEKYFESVGEIVLDSTDEDSFEPVNANGRKVLNSEDYKGFVINTSDLPDEELNLIEAPLTIISDTQQSDGKIRFLDMKAILSGQSDAQLSIYFDANNQCYVIESDQQIIIDADLYTNQNDDITSYDEYSSVLKEENSITSLKGICSNMTYSTEELTPVPVFDNEGTTNEIYYEGEVGQADSPVHIVVDNGIVRDDVSDAYYTRTYNLYYNNEKEKKIRVYAYCYDNEQVTDDYEVAVEFVDENGIIVGNLHTLYANENSEWEIIWSNTSDTKRIWMSREFIVPDVAAKVRVCYDRNKFCWVQVSGNIDDILVDEAKNEERFAKPELTEFSLNTLENGYLRYRIQVSIKNNNVRRSNVYTDTMIHIIGTSEGKVENEYFVRVDGDNPLTMGTTWTTVVESTEPFVNGITWKVSLIDSVEFGLKKEA